MLHGRLFRPSVFGAVLLWGLLGGILQPAGAQAPADSLRASVTLFGAAGTGERLPFWLRANQRGTVDPASANGGIQLSVHRPFLKDSGLDYAVGATVLGRASQHGTATLHELYGRLQYGPVQLTAGRREHIVGRVDTSLSLGSVVRSRNAPPVPRVTISSDGYVPVPGTGGALAARGHLTHGWLESDRFVEGALLHEKALYARFSPPDVPVSAHAGITHHVQWGGTSPLRGPQASSLGEWIDVAFGRDILTDDRPEAESERSQANHIAMYDFSLDVDLGGGEALAYRQFYHEDIASLNFRNVWDGLWGLSLRREDPEALINKILWEHLRMTRQNARFSAGEERGSDKYYSHSTVYRGGWTYQGATIGVPLLTPASRTPGLRDGRPGIGNSIVVAHHLGIEGALGAGLSYRAVGTYSRNYGAQGVCESTRCESLKDERTDRRDQWSVRLEVRGPLWRRNLRFRVAAALDAGHFYEERLGLHLGLTWRRPLGH